MKKYIKLWENFGNIDLDRWFAQQPIIIQATITEVPLGGGNKATYIPFDKTEKIWNTFSEEQKQKYYNRYRDDRTDEALKGLQGVDLDRWFAQQPLLTQANITKHKLTGNSERDLHSMEADWYVMKDALKQYHYNKHRDDRTDEALKGFHVTEDDSREMDIIKTLYHYVTLLSTKHGREAFDKEQNLMGLSYDYFNRALRDARNYINPSLTESVETCDCIKNGKCTCGDTCKCGKGCKCEKCNKTNK